MSLGRKTLLKNFAAADKGVALCPECGGTGFSGTKSSPHSRHCRRCPKCKGTGRLMVGSTKR